MGFLTFLSKPKPARLVHLPSGSFTIDRDGKVMTSTLPQSFPNTHMEDIGRQVIASFEAAKQAQMPLAEIIIYYAALKILARELRGGAIIFLMPQSLNQPLKRSKT
jgi:hypothetical protein